MTQEENLLSIGEVAKRSGVASSALRYYERCGLINAGAKIGGRRHFPLAVLHRLSVIKVCQHIGFSLAEISELLNGSLAGNGAWRRLAMSKRRDLQVQIGQMEGLLELLERTLGCECHALGECPQMAPGGYLADRGGVVETPEPCQALEGWQQGA
ncbi:MerR family transcriptional regulator [Actinophytocola sp.]|uniref:MerR family transcriptional regulator n=1 Tax=Actinophytocola sp. TaxID=1872138 RepID=UPI003D6BF894